jgi:FAD/FMN-containing dehydrogenase
LNTLFFKNKLWIWLFISLLVLWFAYPILRVGYFLISDPIPEEQVFTLTETLIDDASRLNRSTHLGIIKLSPDLNQSIATLRDTLKRAQIKKQKVIPLGARHSMGKQSIGRDAIHIDLSAMNKMGMEDGLLRVQAGARWREVLRYLAPLGLSVEVMQSNADFSIGGTLSVNAHGWQPDRPPVSSTVEMLSLIDANGEVLLCSRAKNAELFKHVLGGYGLMGIIIEVWIRPVPNEILRSSHTIVECQNFSSEWNRMKEGPVRLAYARLSVAPSTFFKQVLLSSYQTTGEISNQAAQYEITSKTSLARAIFRASLNSDRGKSFRQWMENLIGGEAGGVHSRANLLIEPVRIFTNNDSDKTDILVEIFIPQEKFSDFMPLARELMINQSSSLLNVTIREICRDSDTALPYATQDMFGLVMLFTIDRRKEAEEILHLKISTLIDLAIKYGGTFYLPYRNYANSEQIKKAYPTLENFISTKQQHDPSETFVSDFYYYLLQSTDQKNVRP